jgi:hypothetical protein
MRLHHTFLACGISLLLSCDKSGAPVQFSVPDGFHGVFKVSVDRQHGMRPAQSNGVWVVVVPTNAHLRIADDRYFTRWHSETASFYSGKPIIDDGTSTNSIALRSLFADSDGNYWWLVGTTREQDIANLCSQGQLPLGRPLTDGDLPHYAKGR